MRSTSILLLSSLLIGNWATTVVADSPLKPGMIVENYVLLGDTSIQAFLPEGKWEVAATYENWNASGVGSINRSAMLYQSTNGTVSRMVLVITNKDFIEVGFPPSR